MLAASGISKHFAGISALDGVDMEVARGEIVGLVGPNGSGKSTLLAILSGFQRPSAGTVTFEGKRIDGMRPWDVAKLGVQRIFQLPSQPERLTVLEMMLLGVRMDRGGTIRGSLFSRRTVAREQREGIVRARVLLDELTLLPLQDHAAGMLSGGQQKLLALGVALMGEPGVLLLDEPTAGVHSHLKRALVERLRALHASGTTLVVVEHDMGFVADLCERVYVLDKGQVVTCCAPSELIDNPRVVEAYLGKRRKVARDAQ